MRAAIVSLGCAKNQTDAQTMLSLVSQAGYEIVTDPAMAEVILVNTCGFITSAKEESISAILDMAAYKSAGSCKALIVTGCLSQRYADAMPPDLPEVDAFVGIGHIGDIVGIISCVLAGHRIIRADDPYRFVDAPQLPQNPGHYAYVKVADGCDNRCSYCAIPLIRGGALSRPMDAVIDQARALAAMGAKELIPIAQDTTRYGADIYGAPKLLELLTRLCAIDGVEWVRPLYLYPDWIDRAFIDELASMDKLCKYLDLPVQHADDEILAKMRRRGSAQHLRDILLYAKSRGFAIRTTVIAGFPGETEAQHRALLDFIREIRFDRLGAFAYSQEEDTDAAAMDGQVPPGVREARARAIMRAQRHISRSIMRGRVGQPLRVLIEGERDDAVYRYHGRSEFEAPEVDGGIFIKGHNLTPGRFARAVITGASDYDLYAEVLP